MLPLDCVEKLTCLLGGAGEHDFYCEHPNSKGILKDMRLHTSTCLLAILRVGVCMYMRGYASAHAVLRTTLTRQHSLTSRCA